MKQWWSYIKYSDGIYLERGKLATRNFSRGRC